MFKNLGFSVYISAFEEQWQTLLPLANTGAAVFLSLHMTEELGGGFRDDAGSVCRRLSDNGFKIIADVSPKTVKAFEDADLPSLAERLGIWALRVDCGFSAGETARMADKMPVFVNATTAKPEDLKLLPASRREIYAMHNYYPRPETGLDEAMLRSSTRIFQDEGIRVFAFIPGDKAKRGPIHEGLPTLEAHRNVIPSAAFADLRLNYGMDGIFLGDPGISKKELDRIKLFCRDDILSLPVFLEPEFEKLYGRTFTCRVDSPRRLVRFAESRAYSCFGERIEPRSPKVRTRGSITIDNVKYARYSGEIQLIRQDLEPDHRVNVIGCMEKNAMLMADIIEGGQRFKLVRP